MHSTRKEVLQRLEERYPSHSAKIQLLDRVTLHAGKVIDATVPYAEKVYAVLEGARIRSAPFNIAEYAPMMLGLAMVFFGNRYTMFIAVVETVRLLCWADLCASVAVLRSNFETTVAQDHKDNGVGADGNWKAGVQTISDNELLHSKASLFLKSVDVKEVRTATRTLCTAFFTVIAALRIRLARTITLAGSLTNLVKEYVPVKAVVTEVMPQAELWSSVIADALVGGSCMMIVLTLSGVTSTLHSSVRGSDLFVSNALAVARRKGLVSKDMTLGSTKVKVLIAMVAVTGFVWQITNYEGLPFPLNVLLVPLTILEWVLGMLVSGCLYAVPM